ncbi:MAG: SDR family oxidoreductase [Ramlibacter sp.]|nr:SDR family oxidoreductase [Ramlibacter sp.]MCW5650894.1 SDR family oxidoreductase [Ramlibacter sp.]
MRILLTGGTGFVGGAVAAELAQRGLLDQTVFIVRATDAEEGCARLRETLLRFGASEAQARSVTPDRVLCADLLDIAAIADSPLLAGLTQVIHCAALATFSNNPRIWASNVDGTLALARAVLAQSRLTRWVQVGTAMCCGPGMAAPVGESWEAGTDEKAHLVPYTRSKVAAELALRALPGLPLVVARPSIVVGHSRLGCAPSPSIFWVFRMAFALERFTCAPEERIDIIPADWCAQALVTLALKPQLASDLYHVSAGMGSSNRFTEIDAAYAAAAGTPPVAPRYQQVRVDGLRGLVPLFEQRLGRVNRLLILRALTLYGAFAELNYVFDNGRLIAEGIAPAPPLAGYIGECVRTSEGVPMTQQMAHDFK